VLKALLNPNQLTNDTDRHIRERCTNNRKREKTDNWGN